MGRTRVRAGYAAHLTAQRFRNDCVVILVIELKDAWAAAKDTDTAANAEAALNCWMPLDLRSWDTVPCRLFFNHS